MCGIGGILRVQQPGDQILAPHESIPEAWLDIIDDSIKHRGPDGHGRFRDRATRPDGSIVDVALVHRRLSIIDHTGGHQPMLLGGLALRADSPGGLALRADSPGGLALRADSSPGTSALRADSSPRTSALRADSSPRTSALRADSSSTQSHTPAPTTNLLTTTPYQQTQDHTLTPCPCCGDRTLAVVFNGCIYNHRELRKELQALGHVFTTDHADTEVLLHGYRQWQEQLPDHLEGMYALAIWDAENAALFSCRDRAGEKPLYDKNRHADDVYLFASSVVGLTRLDQTSQDQMLRPDSHDMGPGPGNDPDWLARHASFWLDGFDNNPPQPEAHALAPDFRGHPSAPHHDHNATRIHPMEERKAAIGLSEDASDRMIEQAVRSRLEADVPVGCFLSGGVDSSLVALHAHRASGGIDTFTVRMPDARYDESHHAEQAAKIIGCTHHTLDCDADAATDLVHLIHQLGLPFGDSSLLPTYWLSRATRQHVKVALSGDGADELFCGYDRHAAALKMRWLRYPLYFMPARLFPDRHPKSLTSKVRRLVRWAQSDPPTMLFSSRNVARLTHQRQEPRCLISAMFLDDLPTFDFMSYLPDDLLRKTDTASMAVGLEVRSPFLTQDLITACLRAPLSSLMPRGERKGLLRAVARRHFPSALVDRPKMGFAIPIGDWFRNDFGSMRQLLHDHLNATEPFGPDALGINDMINMNFVHQMLREHDAAGEKSLYPWHGRDHSQRLYMLLVMSIWAKWLGSLDTAA